jgi:hypothetical protein
MEAWLDKVVDAMEKNEMLDPRYKGGPKTRTELMTFNPQDRPHDGWEGVDVRKDIRHHYRRV